MKNKLFNNPKPAIIAIIMIILGFATYKANATEMELGAAYTGEFNGGFGLTVIERVFDGKIDLGIAIISDQQWDNVSVSNNGFIFAAFVAEKPGSWFKILPSEISLGATYWIKTQSPINGCQLGYMLSLKWLLTEQASIGIRHASNGGTCKPNRGQDLLMVGWRF